MRNDFDYNRELNNSNRSIPVLKTTPIFCVTLCIFFISISFIFEVEIITVSKGKIIPESDIMYVNSLISNKITDVYVKNGDFVEDGSAILKYDLSKEKKRIKDYISEKNKLESQLTEVDKIINDIYSFTPNSDYPKVNLLKNNEFKYLSKINRIIDLSRSKIMAYEYENRQNKIKSSIVLLKISRLEREIKKQKEIIEIDSKLVIKGMINKREYQETLHEYELLSIDLNRLKSEYELSKEQLNNHDQKIKIIKNELLYELEKIRFDMLNKIKSLKSDIQWDNKMLENEILLSNFSGYISDMTENIVGNFISRGEIILKIVPKDNQYRVRSYVSSSDIGFVKLGQKVRLRIEAFNYNRYGYLEGNVVYVSKDSKYIDGDMSYELITSIEGNSLNFTETPINIMSGLSVNADIITGHRTIASYFLEPITHSMNYSLIER
ncbi:HlyD family efflux transporter periplasmic adaptor subunit [Vibrio vulnificus]|uniref:HlyD family secretion protein n=1 Tax=Vibrio vulnificus TaxID=672 RepID=A0AAN1PMA4_VIBVL|nr:HlyD family efflux transporter periplasmic adaptor subunit [Vibrio vulnificus]AXX58819.1 HlyD family secretion protein [Vibrio vulnificus]